MFLFSIVPHLYTGTFRKVAVKGSGSAAELKTVIYKLK
jgi:hypothetical protein